MLTQRIPETVQGGLMFGRMMSGVGLLLRPGRPDAGCESSIGHHRDFKWILGRDRAGGVGDFGRGGGGFRFVGKDADDVGAAAVRRDQWTLIQLLNQ